MEELIHELQKRIKQGNDILERLSHLNIDGVSKLRNKIKQEINFLQKVCIGKKM